LPTTTPHAMDLEPCAHCGAPDAPNFCSGCRAVRYCGAACQRADWHEHKPRCNYIVEQYGKHDHTGGRAGTSTKNIKLWLQLRRLPLPFEPPCPSCP
jgi:hypothetical protein